MSSENKRKYVPIKKEKVNCRFWFMAPLVYTREEPCLLKKCQLPVIHTLDTECHYRPLLTIGLLLIKFLKRLLIPVSAACRVGVVHAKENEDSSECDPSRKLVRACDLPFYEEEEKKCIDCIPTEAVKDPLKDSLFTETVKCMRQEAWYLLEQGRIIRNQLKGCLDDVKTQSGDLLNYFREESNVVPRAGAIAVGGLSGYILALRKGLFKKLLYSSVGAGGMAALCYPKETKQYSDETFKQIKKYFIIGYHFMNGVSRDLTGYQLPPLPNGHFVISDSAHPGPEAVPSSAHLLPPTATPTHIPLPHEDPHEIIKNHHQKIQSSKEN